MAISPSYDDLFRNNEQYVGDMVYYQSQVIQVIDVGQDQYQLRVNVTQGQYGWQDTVFLRYAGSRLLENDIIDFVGKVVGLITYKAVLGNSITIPDISVIQAEIVTKAGSQENSMTTSTLTPSPTPTPNTPIVEIVSRTSYLDTAGYYHVVGEVKNYSSNMLSYVQVTATFYNSAGTVVGTGFTYTTIDTLMPNQKSSFEVVELDTAISAQVDHYVLAVSDFSITSEAPYREFSILSNSSSQDTLGYYHVVGEVQNTGGQAATYVEVVGTFYDSAGGVIATDYSYTSPSSLTPGQIAPFEIFVLDATLSAKISSYTLQVQS